MSDMRKYAAEFLGSLLLVLFGVGSLVFAGGGSLSLIVLSAAFTFAIVVMSLIYTIGPISGCHINPAVTIAVLFLKGIKAKDAAIYIVVQIIGGIIGAGILYGIASGNPAFDIKAATQTFGTVSYDTYGIAAVFILEIITSMVLIVVILGSLDKASSPMLAGVSIGFVVAAVILFSGAVDGAGLNPIRSISPAVIDLMKSATPLGQAIVISIANIIGGVIGAGVWKYVLAAKA